MIEDFPIYSGKLRPQCRPGEQQRSKQHSSPLHGVASICGRSLIGLLIPIACAVFALPAQAQTGWEWRGELYLWGASLGGETTSGSNIDVSFGTILDDLEAGVMAAVKAERQQWMIFADLIYLDASASETGTLQVGSGAVGAEVSAEAKSVISTFGAAYALSQTQTSRFSLLGGARYLWVDSELKAFAGGLNAGLSDKETAWDAVVGLAGDVDLSESWYLAYYADVGGGQSDLTWQALAAVHYRFERFDLALGYRHLEWDLDDFGSFDELSISGPFLGARFKF